MGKLLRSKGTNGNPPPGKTGSHYSLKVRGALDDRWSAWFDGLTMKKVGEDQTLFTGLLSDQAALHGVLAKIRDLGLTLLSVQLIEPSESDPKYQFTTHVCVTAQDFASTDADEQVLMNGLWQNILKHFGNVESGKTIRIFLRDPQSRVWGGICGNVFDGWIYISLLWVAETLRKQGYGSELLSRLETEAIQFGCGHAHVDTYRFEARHFYERTGYQVFAKLDDYPAGECKYFLHKTLREKEYKNKE
jgi:GNAT superfamily N-acetyltransferase